MYGYGMDTKQMQNKIFEDKPVCRIQSAHRLVLVRMWNMGVCMKKKLRIAMFGHKRWSREGGVEIVVKELCTRMARMGCQVTCYNRSGHHVSGAEYDSTEKTEYQGIRQKVVPTIEKKGARDIIGSTKKNHDN